MRKILLCHSNEKEVENYLLQKEPGDHLYTFEKRNATMSDLEMAQSEIYIHACAMFHTQAINGPVESDGEEDTDIDRDHAHAKALQRVAVAAVTLGLPNFFNSGCARSPDHGSISIALPVSEISK